MHDSHFDLDRNIKGESCIMNEFNKLEYTIDDLLKIDRLEVTAAAKKIEEQNPFVPDENGIYPLTEWEIQRGFTEKHLRPDYLYRRHFGLPHSDDEEFDKLDDDEVKLFYGNVPIKKHESRIKARYNRMYQVSKARDRKIKRQAKLAISSDQNKLRAIRRINKRNRNKGRNTVVYRKGESMKQRAKDNKFLQRNWRLGHPRRGGPLKQTHSKHALNDILIRPVPLELQNTTQANTRDNTQVETQVTTQGDLPVITQVGIQENMPRRLGKSSSKGKSKKAKKKSNKSKKSVKSSDVVAHTQGSAYSKKKIKGSSKTKKTVSSEVARSIKAYLDPFATSDGARLPDGAVTSSIGVNHHQVFQLAGAAGPESIVEMIMFPGLQGGLVWRARQNGQLADNVNFIPYNTTDIEVDAEVLVTPLDGFAFTNECQIQTDLSLAKWRVVSSGVKLTCVNSDEGNGGWWEACRFAYKPNMGDWNFRPMEAIPYKDGDKENVPFTYELKDLKYMPAAQIFERFTDPENNRTINIAEQRAYSTGAIKHIHNHKYCLGHYQTSNDLKSMEHSYNLPSDDFNAKTIGPVFDNEGQLEWVFDPTRQEYIGLVQALQGSADGKKIFQSFFDDDFDCIYLRLYLQPDEKTGSAGTFLVEHSTHHEVVYENDTTLAKFMRPGQKANGLLGKAKKVKQNRDAENAHMDGDL